MSRVSSIDLREFRDRGRDEYAYADPMEEIGHGRRTERQHPHRQHHRDRGTPRHAFEDPIFVQPGSQHFFQQGPIVTTPSMELQVPRRHNRYPPGVVPQYPSQNGYPIGYDPNYRGTPGYASGNENDVCLLIGAFFVIFCCPFGLFCGIPALVCLWQARESNMRGNVGEGQRSRQYSMYLSACGGFLGVFMTIIIIIVPILVVYVFGVSVTNRVLDTALDSR